MSSFLDLRHLEPDQFHAMVKMHLSFLLDLNTDDCDCNHIYNIDGEHTHNGKAATPGKNNAEGAKRKRMQLLTPRRLLPSSDRGASSLSSKVMSGAALTMEGVCQVYQIVQHLERENNLGAEGLFRRHGNLKKQSALKERLNRGVIIDLDDGEFSVHECSGVLKSFLSDLPEPLLTDACYRAHCQVAMMGGKKTAEDDDDKKEAVRSKKVQCLQLLLLLIPEPNYKLLKDLMALLKRVTDRVEDNRMSAGNLGTLFAPLILCPRKLSAEALQSNHQLLTAAVTFMVEEADSLFDLPEQLRRDIEIHMANRKSHKAETPKKMPTLDDGGRPQSPVVNTIFSFVDRERTQQLAAETSTETALAELYAQTQAMPESAQKRRLISKLNDANGHGTPGLFSRGGGHVSKTKASGPSEGLKNLLTPKRMGSKKSSGATSGSYSFKQPSASKPLLHSFKRQSSEQSTQQYKKKQQSLQDQKLLSPQSSPAILVSPAAIDSIAKKLDGGDRDQQDLDGSYVAPSTPKMSTFRPPHEDTKESRTPKPPPPAIPQRISSLQDKSKLEAPSSSSPVNSPLASAVYETASPISDCAKKLSDEMQREMMTPRSRRPVTMTQEALKDSDGFKVPAINLPSDPASPPMPPCESPCQPPKYNEDEPEIIADDEERLTPIDDKQVEEEEEEVEDEEGELEEDDDEACSTDSECDKYFASLEDLHEECDARDEPKSSAEVTREDLSSAAESLAWTPGVSSERDVSEIIVRNRAYTSRTLKKDFTDYLECNGLERSCESSVLETSAVSAISVTSSVISNEARQMLSGEVGLSDSMLAVMNGDDPAPSRCSETEVVQASVLTPVSVDDYLSDITEEESAGGSNNVSSSDKENCVGGDEASFVSAKSVLSAYSSASAMLPTQDIPAPIFGAGENHVTNCIVLRTAGEESQKKRTRKRRSLTESAETNAMAKGNNVKKGVSPPKRSNIYFETDL